jgi:hypothetical protein
LASDCQLKTELLLKNGIDARYVVGADGFGQGT